MSTTASNALSHPLTKSEDSDLIVSLYALSNKSPKLVKSTAYPAPADPSIEVRSWKMNEHKYYDVPSPFPTLARGIFSVKIPQQEKDGKQGSNYRIVARGYDKFFNIGEVPWNTWQSLKAHTVAPYTLSLKSNGCIIFIGALTPSKLLITSKHAIGAVKSQTGDGGDEQPGEVDEHEKEESVAGVGQTTLSHAEAGEAWLRKYLKAKGKTEADFAKVLWDNNWTAVAELCDDSFEEHVLPYPPHLTGLHLHGLNTATKVFHTLTQDVVDRFAEEWGFIRTLSTVCNSIEEVQEFTDRVGKEQVWEGQAVEGFVVRTVIGTPPPEAEDDGKDGNAGKDVRGRQAKNPYSPGSTFFFKVKFDEPYMMYRDWREVTKSLISLHKKHPSFFSAASADSLPKNKMKRPETRVYVKWVIGEIKKNPKAFVDFGKGKGIIATREKFLKWVEETEEGRAEMEKARGKRGTVEKVATTTEKDFDKTIIVPIAIPGCGKTTVAVALAHIFGFGHTQSDDVHVKKSAPVFIKNVMELLETHEVVIADKNNHLRQHRSSLREAAGKISPPKTVRLLALSYPVASVPHSTLIRICGDRVMLRGDNHQTLRADRSGAKSHEDIVWRFIGSFEELSMDEVDEVIELDLEWSVEEAVRYSAQQISKILELPKPSEEKVKESLDVAMGYKPKSFNPDTQEKEKKTVGIKYFALMPEVDVLPLLEKVFTEGEGKEQSQFFEEIKKKKRVTKRPHITLVHKNSLPNSDRQSQGNGEGKEDKDLWDRSEVLHAMDVPPTFEFELTDVVWDDRVMAIAIDGLRVEASSSGLDKDQKGAEFVKELPGDVRARLHITVGTVDDQVAPVEGKALVERWRKGEQGIHSLKLVDEGAKIVGRVKGLQY